MKGVLNFLGRQVRHDGSHGTVKRTAFSVPLMLIASASVSFDLEFAILGTTSLLGNFLHGSRHRFGGVGMMRGRRRGDSCVDIRIGRGFVLDGFRFIIGIIGARFLGQFERFREGKVGS